MGRLLGNIQWKRFWIPREVVPPLDGQGYLADPEGAYGKIANPQARTLEQLEDTPCVALLGEPGVGKSYVVRAYSAALIASEGAGTVISIDCRWDRDLKEDIFATEPFKRWMAEGSPLTIIIDSLDEHPQGAYECASQLIGKLKRGPVASLRLRIACRTAEWPSILDEQLPHLWRLDGEEVRAVFYTLAPLRYEDVAHTIGGDATAFLEQIAQRDAQPLAIKPITLEFLLEEYRRHGALPRTREELYRSGCTILCEETSTTREGSGRVGVLQPEQRLAIASRIAAVSILCRRSLVHRGALRSSLSPDALRLGDLVGGTEPSRLGEVEVTTEHLDEVLRVSGLFASRGAEYVGWAHQTYAEFLAASFLRARGLSADEALRELSNRTVGRMVPALRETAAWLSGMDKGVFDRLLTVDPELLLGSDFAMVGAAEQEVLTERLLQEIERKELNANTVLFHRDVRARLGHPRLAEQLLPYIVEPDHYVMARCAAIGLAERCETDALQGVVADRALDSAEVYEVRVAAARMICRLGSRATKRRLKPLIFGDCGADPENALKGHALEALWPNDLDAAELFANLEPLSDETQGSSYQSFLYRLGESLAPESLAEALRWTLKLPARHGLGLSYAFASLLEAILVAGWESIHNDDVRAALAEAVRRRLALHDGIFEHQGHRRDKIPDLAQDDVRRRLLSSALMGLPPWGEHDVYSLHHKLVLPRDVPWALEQMKAESSASQRARWAALLSYIARNQTFEIVDPIIAALPEMEELQRTMPWAFPLHVELGSPESRRMRREVNRVRKLNGKWRYKEQPNRKKKRHRPSAKRLIRHAMRQFAEGNLEFGRKIQFALNFAPKDKSRIGHEDWDLTKFHGWQNAEEETRERVVDIGRSYLLRSDERSGEWLGRNIWYHPARAGYRYLRLIESVDPSWLDKHAGTIWTRWSTITLAFDVNANEGTQRLVARAYRSQPIRVLGALRALLLERHGRNDYPFPIFHMEFCWDAALGRFLLNFVREHAELKPRFLGELLDQMIIHKIDGAVAYTASLLPLSVAAGGTERLVAHAAAHALMAHAPEIGWPLLQNIVERDSAFGVEVFLTFPDELDRGRSRPWGKGLPIGDAENLYTWVERYFPPDEDPNDEGPGFHAVTPRHMVAELRGKLLNELASRATPEAVAAITRIQQTFPCRDFTWALLSAKEAAAQGTWTPRSPREIIDLRPVAAVSSPRVRGERLLHVLGNLLPAQLDALIYKLNAPLAYLPGRDAPPATRIADLLYWAEQQGKLADVEALRRNQYLRLPIAVSGQGKLLPAVCLVAAAYRLRTALVI